jgi:hypothetical protein
MNFSVILCIGRFIQIMQNYTFFYQKKITLKSSSDSINDKKETKLDCHAAPF